MASAPSLRALAASREHTERALAVLRHEVFTWRLVAAIVWCLPSGALTLAAHALVTRLDLAAALAALGAGCVLACAVRWVLADTSAAPPHLRRLARVARPSSWALLAALGLVAHTARLAVQPGPALVLSCHVVAGSDAVAAASVTTHCVQVQ